MAMRNDDKASRGLFGLGARRHSPAAAPTAIAQAPAPRPAPGAADPMGELRHLNAKALAASTSLIALGQEAAPSEAGLEVSGLVSRPARYRDIQSPWLAYWAGQLDEPVRPHRKLWEFVAILQTLYEQGVLEPGARGLGFGTADEPLPSYLAGLGLSLVATDLPGETERDRLFNPKFVDSAAFDERVEISNLDLRRLDDPTLRGFDFCWSSGVLNNFHALDEAADAVIGAMDVLRPGGVAVHTTDFAFAEDMPFSPKGGLAFPRRFFERLADQLNGRKHEVAALDFGLGDHPLDGYIDLEPFEVDGADVWRELWQGGLNGPHLKICLDGILKTSFVFAVRCRPAEA